MGQIYYISHIEAAPANRADAYATFWRKAINRTNTGAWQRLFNNPLWGGLRHLSKKDLLEAETIAGQLAEDSAILHSSIISKFPDINEIPTLIGVLRAEWDRAGIPEEIRNHEDLLAYFHGNVLPLFPDDYEARGAALTIGSRIDYEIMDYIRESLIKLRKLAGIPEYIYINTPLTTAQLKEKYNSFVARRYIARDTWQDFYRCFDSLALSPGHFYWKIVGKNEQPNKRAMCEFLSLFGIDRKDWAKYVRALFHEDISPGAISNAAAGIRAAETGITTTRAAGKWTKEIQPTEYYNDIKAIIEC